MEMLYWCLWDIKIHWSENRSSLKSETMLNNILNSVVHIIGFSHSMFSIEN